MAARRPDTEKRCNAGPVELALVTPSPPGNWPLVAQGADTLRVECDWSKHAGDVHGCLLVLRAVDTGRLHALSVEWRAIPEPVESQIEREPERTFPLLERAGVTDAIGKIKR